MTRLHPVSCYLGLVLIQRAVEVVPIFVWGSGLEVVVIFGRWKPSSDRPSAARRALRHRMWHSWNGDVMCNATERRHQAKVGLYYSGHLSSHQGRLACVLDALWQHVFYHEAVLRKRGPHGYVSSTLSSIALL